MEKPGDEEGIQSGCLIDLSIGAIGLQAARIHIFLVRQSLWASLASLGSVSLVFTNGALHQPRFVIRHVANRRIYLHG